MFIYVLIDPRDNLVRYVGATKNLTKRLWEHLHDNRNKCHRKDWIQFLMQLGLEPHMEVIETCPDNEWESRERYWIKYYRDAGYDLTNATDGGDGTPYPSDEIRQKISRSRKGKFTGENHPNFGVHWSDEVRKKMSDAKKTMYEGKKHHFYGKKHSEQSRANMRAGHVGQPPTFLGKRHKPESIAKMRAAKIGKAQSPESNAKRRASESGEGNPFWGKHHTDETKRKLSAARMGKKMSPEVVAKIRESMIQLYRRKRDNQTI